ncbi:hypothetical protein Btru_004349 [Bulinus truncatus]|nr:hypothetical protein Btru_004349 [Bulinus truncatus]
MVLSVAKLKALLEQRGVSYEGVIEKSELSRLVDSTGDVITEEAETALEESDKSADTNFTSGAHFIEQVEDAKDSVWLVQILSFKEHHRILSNARWEAIQHRAAKFGVRTGILDCALDYRYCHSKGWNSPFLLLALPGHFEKKANVAMYNYSGSFKETAVMHWVHEKLNEKVQTIKNPFIFHHEWKSFSGNQIESEIRAVLFTNYCNTPMFFSALSVKFPGRVKFGVVCLDSPSKVELWKDIFSSKILKLPAYIIYSQENTYIYGNHPNEQYSFNSMEIFFKFLYPCSNDIFILSFCVANIMPWFELFISNCGALRRIRKLLWCVVKYNIILIMLWLPMIGIFQMPFLDRIPFLALKIFRVLCTSTLGTILRSDFIFFMNNPAYICSSFIIYIVIVTVLSKKYRGEEPDEDWFNFAQMRTLTYLRPNDFFEPMRIGGSDFLGGLEIFGSQLSQPSLWLQPSVSSEYIKYLPTWPYSPKSISERLQDNICKMEQVLNETISSASSMNISCSGVSKHNNSCCEYHKIKCSCVRQSSAMCENNQESFEDFRINPSPHNNHIVDSVASSSVLTSHSPSQDSQSTCTLQTLNDQNQTTSVSEISSVQHNADLLTLTSSTVNLKGRKTVSESTSNQPKSTSEPNIPPPESTSSPCDNGFPSGYIETYQCVICLDDFVSNVVLCGLPCGHVFHETCIIKWLNKDKHFCPMCRWPSYKLLQNTPHY